MRTRSGRALFFTVSAIFPTQLVSMIPPAVPRETPYHTDSGGMTPYRFKKFLRFPAFFGDMGLAGAGPGRSARQFRREWGGGDKKAPGGTFRGGLGEEKWGGG